MGKFYDISAVKAAAKGAWPSVLGRLGVDSSLLTDQHSACPGCGGKDRFRFDDKDGDGSWLCSGGSGGGLETGDGVALLMHVRSLEWKEAVNMLGESLGIEAKVFKGGQGAGKKNVDAGVKAPPVAKKVSYKDLYDEKHLREGVAGVEKVDVKWFMDRSPVDVRRVTTEGFLNTIFDEGERALIFSNFYSQGDFGFEVGRGGFVLGKNPDIKAVKSDLPKDGGKDGIWFLSNPVSLKWVPKPNKQGERGRRHKDCVTDWKYLVLESDDAPDELWLKYLAVFPDPIRAIYSSGGKSWHALIAVYKDSWEELNGLLKGNPDAKRVGQRLGAKAVWAKSGADAGALSPVRLTRLPGCTRKGEEQKLIYLNPNHRAQFKVGGVYKKMPIMDLVPMRSC